MILDSLENIYWKEERFSRLKVVVKHCCLKLLFQIFLLLMDPVQTWAQFRATGWWNNFTRLARVSQKCEKCHCAFEQVHQFSYSSSPGDCDALGWQDILVLCFMTHIMDSRKHMIFCNICMAQGEIWGPSGHFQSPLLALQVCNRWISQSRMLVRVRNSQSKYNAFKYFNWKIFPLCLFIRAKWALYEFWRKNGHVSHIITYLCNFNNNARKLYFLNQDVYYASAWERHE